MTNMQKQCLLVFLGYDTGDCCTENGLTYRSTMDNNVWAPSAYAAAWEVV